MTTAASATITPDPPLTRIIDFQSAQLIHWTPTP